MEIEGNVVKVKMSKFRPTMDFNKVKENNVSLLSQDFYLGQTDFGNKSSAKNISAEPWRSAQQFYLQMLKSMMHFLILNINTDLNTA